MGQNRVGNAARRRVTMNAATFLKIHRRAENKILRAFTIPSGREAYEGKRLSIDYTAIMNSLEAVFLLSKALSIYDLKRRERKKRTRQYNEDDLLGEILRAIDFTEYENIAKRTVREIREDPDSYLKPSPFVDEFLKEYVFTLTEPFEKHSRDIEETLRRGMLQGKAYLDIAEDLEKVMGGYFNRADVIATTESTRVFALGILDAGIESPVTDGFQLIAVMDNRTTEICSQRDRMVIPKDDPELLAENTPPLHPRCRSMLVPHTIYDPKGKTLSREEMERIHGQHPEAVPVNRRVDRDVVKALISSRKTIPTFLVTEDIKRILENVKKLTPEEYAKQVLGVECDYRGIAEELAEEINTTLEELKEKYPKVWEQFDGITSTRNSREAWTRFFEKRYPNASPEQIEDVVTRQMRKIPPNVLAYTAQGFDKIVVKNTFWQNADKLRKTIEGDYNAGWSAVHEAGGIICHEFGHRIDYYLRETGKRTEFTSWISKMRKERGITLNDISGYARDGGLVEAFAELFAGYVTGRKEEVFLLFGEWLEGVL